MPAADATAAAADVVGSSVLKTRVRRVGAKLARAKNKTAVVAARLARVAHFDVNRAIGRMATKLIDTISRANAVDAGRTAESSTAEDPSVEVAPAAAAATTSTKPHKNTVRRLPKALAGAGKRRTSVARDMGIQSH
ncbi:hypothetical protein H4S02_008992 [Coemansia sp. RSA 2611]|nr:hypothetical protein H4S02_008992 [Coemansia sp. RSA 2611]